MALAADAHPEPDASRIPKRPQHRRFVIAEQHVGVAAIASEAQAADAEHSVVDKIAQEHGAPPVRWITLKRGEQTLKVAVDVADDQDRQVAGGHVSMLVGKHWGRLEGLGKLP